MPTGSGALTARHALDAGGARQGVALTFERGTIASVAAAADGADRILMPAVINAHDHARPIRTSSIGGFGKPLEVWLHRLALLAPVDAHLAASAAFGRAALGGQAGAMVHWTRAMGLKPLPEEAADLARAAREVGIRIAFGIGMRDQNPLVYGPSDPVLDDLPAAAREAVAARFLAPMPSIEAQMEAVDAVAAAIAGPMVDVQYGPNGPQWVSDAFWRRIAEASALTGRRITTHLFETKYQRAWADQAYPQGLVRHWRDIGLLSPRLTLAHCVYARPDELEMIAEAGAVIAVNTSSNLALRSGIAPVAEMLRRGCRVALGIDGQAFDEDDDALRELRLLWSLQAGWGFDAALSPHDVMRMAFETGRQAIAAPAGGRLEPGAAADIVVLDRAALDEDAIMDVDPVELLFARGARRHIRELVVAGRTIVTDGQVLGVDLAAVHAELRGHYRAGLGPRQDLAAALPALEGAIARFCAARLGCC